MGGDINSFYGFTCNTENIAGARGSCQLILVTL